MDFNTSPEPSAMVAASNLKPPGGAQLWLLYTYGRNSPGHEMSMQAGGGPA